MAYKDIVPGKYTAKAVQGQFAKSKDKGTPCVGIMFDFVLKNDEHGMPQHEQMWWTGWLTTKVSEKDGKTALERTMETLALIGYDENKGHDANGTIAKDAFDPKCEVEITVEIEPYQGKDGVMRESLKVKWVNRVGGGQFGAVEASEMSQILSGIDIKKEMMVAKQKLGIKTKPAIRNHAPGASNPPPQAAAAKPASNEPPAFNADEDIPF